jgi:hypothetical protein
MLFGPLGSVVLGDDSLLLSGQAGSDFTAVNILMGTPTLDQPSLTVNYTLTLPNLTTSPVFSTLEIGLGAVDLTLPSLATSPTFAPLVLQAVSDFAAVNIPIGTPTLDQPSLTVNYTLTLPNLTTSPVFGSLALDLVPLEISLPGLLVSPQFAPLRVVLGRISQRRTAIPEKSANGGAILGGSNSGQLMRTGNSGRVIAAA